MRKWLMLPVFVLGVMVAMLIVGTAFYGIVSGVEWCGASPEAAGVISVLGICGCICGGFLWKGWMED